MAILRGGKRIGGIDVRIGLPRDRSLDNVTGDPRLKRVQGGNYETTIGRFQSYVNEAEGFARKARFYVEMFLPKSLPSSEVFASEGSETSGSFDETYNSFRSEEALKAVQLQNARRVQAFNASSDLNELYVSSKLPDVSEPSLANTSLDGNDLGKNIST